MFVQSLRSASLLAALVLGAAAFPSSLLAQQTPIDGRGGPAAQILLTETSASADTAYAASAAGPRIAPAGFTKYVAAGLANPTRPIEDSRSGNNTHVAMMGIGAAAVGLGLLVGGEGGTIIAVTGGVVGLVGLYRYLQ
jgi:hypothetical protein